MAEVSEHCSLEKAHQFGSVMVMMMVVVVVVVMMMMMIGFDQYFIGLLYLCVFLKGTQKVGIKSCPRGDSVYRHF
jgi:hypothetical protein